jgi:hypothetical protein
LINPMLRGRVAYFAAGAPSECFTFVKDWVEASSPAAAIGWPPLQIRTRRAPLRSYPLSAMAPDPRGPGHELYPPRVIRRDVRNGLPSCSCHDRYTQRATDLLQYIREIMHSPAASPVFYPSRRLARKSVMGEVDFALSIRITNPQLWNVTLPIAVLPVRQSISSFRSNS